MESKTLLIWWINLAYPLSFDFLMVMLIGEQRFVVYLLLLEVAQRIASLQVGKA